MMRRIAVFALAVLSVLGSHGSASADDQPGAGPGSRHHGHHGFQQWLGLTDDQMAQIRAIRQRDAESWKQVGQQLRQAQSELRRLALNGATPDALQAKEGEVQLLLAQMIELRVKHLQEIAPLLTQEQRDKLAQARGGWWRHGSGPGAS